jgi:hypothetical protein
MHYETSRTAPATATRAWQVLTDIERWPRIIGIYESVRRGDQGQLKVGSTAEIKQKGLRAGTWRVTAITDGQTFTWENTQPGVRTVARHTVVEQPGGRVRIDLSIDQTGWLAGPVGLMLGGRVRSYVDAEADGLAAVAAGPNNTGATPSTPAM